MYYNDVKLQVSLAAVIESPANAGGAGLGRSGEDVATHQMFLPEEIHGQEPGGTTYEVAKKSKASEI